jgi:hypothetical protein
MVIYEYPQLTFLMGASFLAETKRLQDHWNIYYNKELEDATIQI